MIPQTTGVAAPERQAVRARGDWRIVAGLLILLAFLTIPPFVSLFYLRVFILIGLFAYLAVTWNLLAFAGPHNLGHALFIGIGAYTSAVLFVKFGVTPWLGMWVGAVICALLGVFLGFLCFRYGVKGPYFVMITIAAASIAVLVAVNVKEIGAASGIMIPLKGESLYLFQFVNKLWFYYIVVAMLLGALALTRLIQVRKMGYYLAAIRENEDAAQALGISAMKYKLIAFALSAFLASLGGSFYTQYFMFIDPRVVLGVPLSIEVAILAYVGGEATLFGPVLGALVLIPLSQILRGILGSGAAGVHLIVYGVLVILVVIYMPEGIVGWLVKQKRLRLSRAKPIPAQVEVPRMRPAHVGQGSSDDGPLLVVRNATKRFGGLMAVNNLSLEVKRGEILSIIGPNGAGKSTAFGLISGFHPLSGGEIIYEGKSLGTAPPFVRCRMGIARTFQIVKSFPTLSALDNVKAGSFIRYPSAADAERKAWQVLELIGMRQKAHVLARNLTLPDQKRLEIGRALATEPELLLLDETMSGLTPTEQEEAIRLIQTLRDEFGVTFVIVEHVMHIIMRLSDRVIVMHHGEKLAEGTPREVTSNPRVVEAYLGEEMLIA